jgi:hypothetical protein
MLYLLVFILHLLSYGFPSSHQFQGALVRLLAIFSGAVCLAKIVFYAVTVPSDDDSSNDSTAAQLFGFLPISSVLRGFLLVSPDVVVLLLSAILWRSRAFRPPSPAEDLLIEQDSSVVQIARRRRTHRRDMIICAFVVSIIFICLCTAMSAVPSLLVIPYQIFLCVELFAWSSSTKLLDKPLLAIRQMLVVYLVFDIVMIYLAQIPAIYSGIGQATAAKIGVFSLWGSADMNGRAVLQAVMIMLTFLLIAFHSYLARRHDRNPAQHLVAFAKGYQLDQLRHISIFRQTGRLVPRFTKFLNHNSSKVICSFCCLTS